MVCPNQHVNLCFRLLLRNYQPSLNLQNMGKLSPFFWTVLTLKWRTNNRRTDGRNCNIATANYIYA